MVDGAASAVRGEMPGVASSVSSASSGAAAGTVFYVLVNSSTEGMALFTRLREAGCKVRVAPAPRGATTCCGMSILVNHEDMPAVRTALEAHPTWAYDRVVELPNEINPHRDRYC